MAGRRSTLSNAADSLPGSGGGGGGGGGGSGGDPLRELFEACKTGDLAKVKALVNPKTVNARDTAGRKSTPLHFAAGESATGSPDPGSPLRSARSSSLLPSDADVLISTWTLVAEGG